MFEFPLRVPRAVADTLVAPIDALRELRDAHDFAAAVRKNQLGFSCLVLLLPLLRPRVDLDGLNRYSDRLTPILDFIRARIDRKLTVDDVVDFSRMSRAGLFLLFRRKNLNLRDLQVWSIILRICT